MKRYGEEEINNPPNDLYKEYFEENYEELSSEDYSM